MKILIINSEYPPVGGGAGNASYNIANQMAALNHQILVLTSRYDNMLKVENQSGVKIFRGPAKRRKKDRSGGLEQSLFILLGALGAFKIILREKPNVILAFFGIPSGVIAWVMKLLFNIPYIVSLRGGDVPGFRPEDFGQYHRLSSPLIKRVWHNGAAIAANSVGLKNLALKFDDKYPIEVIPNGVNVNDYPVIKRNWDTVNVLSIGRLVYQKGFDILLEALRQIQDLDWELTIVGDGPKRAALETLAIKFGINSRVKFPGWIERPDLLRYYQTATLFAYPSRDEGMPNVVLEAMASGLPVVASNIAGNQDLVEENQTGFLIPPNSAEELSKSLRKIIPDAALREKMGTAGRKRVLKYFSWETTANSYIKTLESSLDTN